jgi:hypothetical protein
MCMWMVVRGMAEEHLVQRDSHEFVTTPNYGISTTPV